MKSKGQKIRENIEDAPHPDDVEGNEGHIAYTARLLCEAGDESEAVADALKYLQDNPREQIAASGKVTDALEDADPEKDQEIADLALSGAFYIRSCRYAAAAIHGVDE